MNVLTAEPGSTKKKKVAPPAEEKKPATETEQFAEPSIKDIITSIDPAKVKLAEKAGIPLTQLINYMAYQEEKLNLVIANMPKKEDMAGAFREGLEELQRRQMETYQKAVAQGGGQGQGGGFMQMLPLITQMMGSGGGGYDEEIQKLTKEIMRANLDRMKQDASFTDAIKTAIVSKIAGKAAAGLV